jgi:hypothetical protein
MNTRECCMWTLFARRILTFLCVGFALCFLGVIARADTIDFETLSGASTFAAAGNAQGISILTSIGNVNFSGGVILTNATNLPADETSIYGTAGNAGNIGVTTGTGFMNPITITFPQNITNFFLDVLNGNTETVTYEVADNLGNSSSVSLAPNLNGGNELIGFAAAGDVVTIRATTGQTTSSGMTWDFFIDNVSFNEPLPTPEPSTILLLGIGLLIVGGATRRSVLTA